MSTFLDSFEKSQPKPTTKTSGTKQKEPQIPSSSFLSSFEQTSNETPTRNVAVIPTTAPTVVTPAPLNPTGEVLSMPKGTEYKSIFDSMSEWSDSIFNHNSKNSVSNTIKNQQKTFEGLQKAPSNLDVMTETGLKSPFKSVQNARDNSASTIESIAGGTGKGLTDVSRGDIPVIGSWIDAVDLAKELNYKIKLNNGVQLTREEFSDLLEISTRRTNQEKKNEDTGYQIGSTVKTSASFMSEIWLASLLAPETGGASIGALATDVAGRGVLKGTKYVAKKMIDDKLTRDLVTAELKKYGVKGSVLVGSQAIVHVPENALTRIIGNTEFTNNTGKVDVSFVNDGQSVPEAIVNSLTESLVETTSEFSGGLLRILAKPVQVGLVKSGILSATLKSNPDVPVNAVMKFFEKAGWHGVGEEFGEERVADVMNGIFNTMGIGDREFRIPTMKQMATELASFALMGSGIKGISEGYNVAIKAKLNSDRKDNVSKYVEDLNNKVAEGLKNDTPSDVIRAMKGAGIDEKLAIDIVMGQVNSSEPTAEDMDMFSAEGVQEEVDAITGGTEQNTTEQEAITQKKESPVKQDIIDLSSIPEEAQGKAEVDWKDNYAMDYSVAKETAQNLEEEVKKARGELKLVAKAKLSDAKRKISEIETEFTQKYAPEQVEEVDQAQAPSQEVIDSYYKKYSNAYTGSHNDPMGSAVEHSRVIANIQKDGYSYEQARDIALEVMYKEQEENQKTDTLPIQYTEKQDKNAPTFETAGLNENFDENPTTFKKGDFIVGRDGRVAEIASGNDKYQKEDPLYDMNIGSLRSKRIGDKKDYVEYANQVRLATPEEIKEAQDYADEHPSLEEMTAEEGDVVLDPFAGSGVTGAEAVKAGRKAVLIEKNEDVAENITKPRVEGAVPDFKATKTTTDINVGDVFYTKGVTNMKSPVKVIEIEGRGIKFKDADGVEYGFFGSNLVKDFLKDGVWERLPSTAVYQFTGETIEQIYARDGFKGLQEMHDNAYEVTQKYQNGAFGQTQETYNVAVGVMQEYAAFDPSKKEEVEEANAENDNKVSKNEFEVLKKGTKVSFEEKGKTLTGEVKNSYPDGTTSVDVDQFDVVGGIPIGRILVLNTSRLTVLDNVDKESNIDSNEQDNRPNPVSNTSDLPTKSDMGGSSEVAGERPDNNGAYGSSEPRNGLGTDKPNGSKLGKKGRQQLNEEVEALLELREYSTSPDAYTLDELDKMALYSGAGGKESVGGSGAGLLNEYYTPREVVVRMWNIIERLMPNAQTIFEPSAGIGKIINDAPVRLQVDGAEISKVSGTIAQILNPQSNITIGDFQEMFFDRTTNKQKKLKMYDGVIGNPPFGERAGFLKGKGEESGINRQEEYFIKRGLDMTNEGGYLVYVVNSSFLKTLGSRGKQKIAELGELVEAYRLPENAFDDTSIGTDIVIFRKGNVELNSDEHLSRQKTINADNYFENHPQNKLGAHMLRKNRFGQTEGYVKGTLEDAMTYLDTILPETPVVEYVQPVAPELQPVPSFMEDTVDGETQTINLSELAGKMGIPFTEVKIDMEEKEPITDLENAIQNNNGKEVYSNGDIVIVEYPASESLTNTITYGRFKAGNADQVSFDKKSLLVGVVAGETPEQRKIRISAYVKAEQEYVAPVVEDNRETPYLAENKVVFDKDVTPEKRVEWGNAEIERINDSLARERGTDTTAFVGWAAKNKNTEKGKKVSDLLAKRKIVEDYVKENKVKKTPEKRVTQEELDHLFGKDKKKATKKTATTDKHSVHPKENWEKLVHPTTNISNKKDATVTETSMLKRIDRDMAIPDPTKEEMKYLNYKDGKYYPDAAYFAREVYQSIDQLEVDKKFIIENFGQEQYDKQSKGLTAVIPKEYPISDLTFDPKDRFIANHPVKREYRGAIKDGKLLDLFTDFISKEDIALTPSVEKFDVIRYVTGQNFRKDTKTIRGKIKADSKRLFNNFIKNELEPEIQKQIADKFNREKNGYVKPNFTMLPVVVQNMAKLFKKGTFNLSQTQMDGISFLVNKGTGLLAWGVGVGKTLGLAVATKANMDKGWTKRPLFIVPDATVEATWIKTIHDVFPGVKINNLAGLQAPVRARLTKERGEVSNWIKDGEITIITHTGIMQLGFKPDEIIDAVQDVKDAIWNEDRAATDRAAEVQDTKIDEITGRAQRFATSVMITDLGIDHVSVDEVHNFRKVFQGVKPEEVEYDDKTGEVKKISSRSFGGTIGGTPAIKAQQLFLITQYIQKRNNGRNVFLASATPIENQATEVYNILSYVARDRMKQMGFININDFLATFANYVTESDRDLRGEQVDREIMMSFNNLQALQALIKEFFDVQEDTTLVRPERHVMTPHLQMSELQAKFLDKIQTSLGAKNKVVDPSMQVEGETELFDEIDSEEIGEDGKKKKGGVFLAAATNSISNSTSPFFCYNMMAKEEGLKFDNGKEHGEKLRDFLVNKYGEEELMKMIIKESPKIRYALEACRETRKDKKTKHFGNFIYMGTQGVPFHPMIARYFAKELGYKEGEVVNLSGSVSGEEKERIKQEFNEGKIKILIGGDQTKEGIDLQLNGLMTINIALDWNPTETMQVEGRVWRQGNNRSLAPLIYPLVENSGDAMIYGKFQEKGGRINDMLSYSGQTFNTNEIDPKEKKLALITDPIFKAKMQISINKEVFVGERIQVETDKNNLNKLRAEITYTKNVIPEYEEKVKMDWLSDERKAEYKKLLTNAKAKLSRLEKKLEEKNIPDINAAIANANIRMVEIDNEIKKVDDTLDELTAKFSKEYAESVAKRKTMDEHMGEVRGFISDLKERTEEEVKAIKAKLVAELEEKNRLEAFKEVVQAPMFQRENTQGEVLISFAEAEEIVKEYQKRLGVDFNIQAVKAIATGDKKKDGSFVVDEKGKRTQAYGVTYNNEISLIPFVRKTTPHHEVMHNMLENIDSVDAFKGASNYEIRKAQNKGKDFTKEEIERIDEELAVSYEVFITDQKTSRLPKIIKDFFERIKLILDDIKAAFVGRPADFNVITDFYRRLAYAHSKNKTKLKSYDYLRNRALVIRNGEKYLDFSFQTSKDMDDVRRVQFERLKEIFTDPNAEKDYGFSLEKKDINALEKYLVISRDLYLKDKVAFAVADKIMKTGDNRRMNKANMDLKFSEMLKPYSLLNKKDQEVVNRVLMQGDELGKEFDDVDLHKKGLSNDQMLAYFAVRKSFKVAFNNLIERMREAGANEEEIETFERERAGYMPHKWKYEHAVKEFELSVEGLAQFGSNAEAVEALHQLGGNKDAIEEFKRVNLKTVNMVTYKTTKEAIKETNRINHSGGIAIQDSLTSTAVDIMSGLSFEKMKSVMANAKTGQDVKDQMLEAMRDLMKQKGFGRHFIKRTGIKGYEQKEVPLLIANYFSGFSGFVTKMEAGKEYYEELSEIDAFRQQQFREWAVSAIAYDMGNTAEFEMLKKIAFTMALANDTSFLLTNATQNWVVGIGELTKLYDNKLSKIVGAEAQLIKATGDWAAKNISPEERRVIEQLLKHGRLGGEMTAELLGFKNNPLYGQLNSVFNTVMYKTTAFVEQNVNRVPAFLAARRILIAKGLSEKEANEEALAVADDIHFRGGAQHRPVLFRGLGGALFIFNAYIRSFLFSLYRDLSKGEFISLTKKMFYTFLLGGYMALPFAEAFLSIVRAILPPDDDEVKDELYTWELALKMGVINAFANIDISSRVNINILGISNILSDPSKSINWLGAVGGLAKRLYDGKSLLPQERYLEAFGKLLPDFLGNPLKAYNGAMYGVTTLAGNPLIDENGEEFKYTTYEGWVKAMGYTPTRERLAWDELSKSWVAKDEQSAKSSIVQGKIKRQIREGDIEGAKATQQEALASGDLTKNSTDNVKSALTDKVMQDSYTKWNTGTKSRPVLDAMERNITKEIYGDKYTPLQLTNVTREFAFYRTFGFDNKVANEIKDAKTTEDKVIALNKAREEMGLDAFKALFNKGRTVVAYEPTSKGGANTGYVLISDTVRKAYFSQEKK